VDVPGKYATGNYFFKWEREWRKLGDFNFFEEDVQFLILPAKLHVAARRFFKDAENENTGPFYDCPFIDPSWEWDNRAAAAEELKSGWKRWRRKASK
jgi:hypothetical protein